MKRLTFLVIIFAFMSTAYADTQADTQADTAAANEQIIVDFLTPKVRVVEQPFYVWSWFNAQDRNPVWKSRLGASSQVGYEHFVGAVTDYWGSYCSMEPTLKAADCPSQNDYDEMMKHGHDNVYGPGFYVSVDPLATISFGLKGANGDAWVLMQIQIPKGFRLIDTWLDRSDLTDADLPKALEYFGCKSTSMNHLDKIFTLASRTGATGTDACKAEIRTILKEKLHLDGFGYGYSSTEFAECDPKAADFPISVFNAMGNSIKPMRNTALVITDATKFSAGDVRVFNSQTRDDLEDRVRIQSLFYKADLSAPEIFAMNYYTDLAQRGTPAAEFKGGLPFTAYRFCTNSAPNGITCKSVFMVCPPGGTCDQFETPTSVPPPPFPTSMPTVMSAKSLPGLQKAYFKQSGKSTSGLLWADLEGVTPTADLGPWITKNLYGCGERAPWEGN